MNETIKKYLLQSTVIAGLATVGFAAPAYAQVEDDSVELLETEQLAEVDEDLVVITGSRIRRPEVESNFPTDVITGDLLDRAAFTNIADALTELPTFGGGVDPFGDQGANIGANFVDFLNLGTQRTLTLVNGRRFVSGNVGGGGLQVDFNILPLALVDRIDTVSIGGAPVYGSDAIAGAINVILKEDFEGFEATGLYGLTGDGDGIRRNFQIVTGANTEDGRGNVTFAAEYFLQDGLLQTDRPELFLDEPFLSEVPAGTAGFTDIDADGDGDPNSVFRQFNLAGGNGQNVQLFTNGGVASPGRLFLPAQGLGGFRFTDTGALVPFEAGTEIPGTSIFFAQGGFQNDFFGAVQQIQSPLERINFASTFKYDLASNVKFKGDVQIANTKAEELVNQGGFQTFAFDGTPNNDIAGALQIPASNPFLSDQARQTLSDELGIAGDDVFFLSRFNNDLLDGGVRESESNVWRISAGFEGDFETAGREFNWEAYATGGQTTNETTGQPLLNDLRFLNAVEAVELTQADVDGIAAVGNNPIGAAGDIVCQTRRDLNLIGVGDRTLDNEDFTSLRGVFSGSGVVDQAFDNIDACRPLNLFGEGNSSAEALDFVSQRGLTSVDIDQRILQFNLSGEVVELPAGWAQFSVGYETRREALAIQTSGGIEVGLGRAAAVPDSGGSFNTDEFSAELYVPLVSEDMEIPFVQTLEVEGQVREIQNNIAGDATVWTVAGRYEPIEDIALRGNITRSVRAPSLTELFQPVVTSFQFADDPCDMRFIGDGEAPENRAANCASIGITQPFTSNIVNATAQGLSGGNDQLQNEEAEGWSLGAVVQPRFVPGLTVTVDYINLELNNLISALTAEQLLQSCFDADPGSFPNASCAQITRDADGQVSSFLSGQTNADTSSNQFLTGSVDYQFDVADAFSLLGADNTGDLGEFGMRTNFFHIIQRDLVLAGVVNPNIIGSFANPRWEGTTDFTYNKGALNVFWRTFWTDRILFSPSGDNFFADQNDNLIDSVPGRFLHNASISYDVSTLTDAYDKPIIVQFNVDNVFDRQLGRDLDRAFGNNGNPEILGRRFTMRVRAAF